MNASMVARVPWCDCVEVSNTTCSTPISWKAPRASTIAPTLPLSGIRGAAQGAGIRQHPVRDTLNGQIGAGGEYRLPLTPVLLPEFPHMGTAWGHGRRIQAARVPAVAECSDAPPGAGTIAADPDRWSWLLHRAGRSLHISVLIKRALVLHHLVGPEITDDP